MTSIDSESFGSDAEDDELILQLSTRPPKTSTQPNLISQRVPSEDANQENVTSCEITLEKQLIKAQGEVGILRDKLNLLEEERKRDKDIQLSRNDELKALHDQEIAGLKLQLQNLEDQKKFLLMDVRKTLSANKSKAGVSSSYADSSSSTGELTATENSSNSHTKGSGAPLIKKRKVVDLPKENYVLLANRAAPDESGAFFDFLMLHKIAGVGLSTIEILDRLKMEHIEQFSFETLEVSKGQSIGKSLVRFLLRCKKTMSLDTFIEMLLKGFSLLIKSITLDQRESDIAVPFLIVILYQTIIFRPSAVQQEALKDLIYFICDLIKEFQNVLKRPLHDSGSENSVEPQVLQYELIDILIIAYSYDVLETSLRILTSYSPKVYSEVLDPHLVKSLEFVYKLALAISYKPVMNVVFSAVEILNLLSAMMVSAASLSEPVQIDALWWKDCVTRLYHILGKGINTYDPFSEEDRDTFYFSRFHEIFGLIRNMGTNTIGRLIPKLLYEDQLQGLPRVISKEDVPEKSFDAVSHSVNMNLEQWLLQLKDNILNLLENLLVLYPNDSGIVNGEMLIQLTRFMSIEQEMMMQRYLGQRSPNLLLRSNLIEHALTLVYRLWIDHTKQLAKQQVKEVESELVTSLWRFIASCDDEMETEEALQHRELIDNFTDLSLDLEGLYEDGLATSSTYIEEERNREIANRTSKIMQIRFDEVSQQMARTILESKLDTVISVEGIDSLYIAMGK